MRLSVTELNNQIKALVESHFELIEVEAEIS
jgi:exonuclease VII large subunit